MDAASVRWRRDPGKVETGFPTRITPKQNHRTKRAQRTAKSCGPGAATLALRWRGFPPATGARKAASPGRARISRKAIARGKPGCLGCTCQNRVHSFATFAHGAAGAVGARLSLRPLSMRGSKEDCKPRADRVARMSTYVAPPSLRGAKATKQSSFLVPAKLDCFASLAMTVLHLSSPGLTGRSSIPETVVIQSRSRGVLDPPLSRGMTMEGYFNSAVASSSHSFVALSSSCGRTIFATSA
jgi:hypothetical protein